MSNSASVKMEQILSKISQNIDCCHLNLGATCTVERPVRGTCIRLRIHVRSLYPKRVAIQWAFCIQAHYTVGFLHPRLLYTPTLEYSYGCGGLLDLTADILPTREILAASLEAISIGG